MADGLSAGSALSLPFMAFNSNAASRTVRVIGPGVSSLWVTGTMPLRLSSPTVGLRPTTPLSDAGQMIEPEVSVPTVRGAKPAATATAEPELEPHGSALNTCGFLVCPPRLLQPLGMSGSRKLAHSLRLVLPKMIDPASLRRFTIKAS
ncbi:hypothetical protein D3C81_1075150 [compost metagenome]